MDIIPLIIVSICQRTPTLRSVFEKICFSKLDYGVMVNTSDFGSEISGSSPDSPT